MGFSLAAWLVANQVFSFVIPYLSYRVARRLPGRCGRTPDEILADALPANLVENAIAGLPLFGGALLLVLGGLVMGSEYGWDTLRTDVHSTTPAIGHLRTASSSRSASSSPLWCWQHSPRTRRPAGDSRPWSRGAPTNWPSLGDLAVGIAAGLLIAGVDHATAASHPCRAVREDGVAHRAGSGVGLLALEVLIRGAAALLDGLRAPSGSRAAQGERGSLVAELVSASGEGNARRLRGRREVGGGRNSSRRVTWCSTPRCRRDWSSSAGISHMTFR